MVDVEVGPAVVLGPRAGAPVIVAMPVPGDGSYDDGPIYAALAAEIAARQAADVPLTAHVARIDNPHATTKAQVGLGNVSNLAPSAYPVSTAQQAALDAKADLVGGKIPTSQIPAIATHETVVVASEAARLALTALDVQPGDEAIVSGGTSAQKGRWLLIAADPSQVSSWLRLSAPGGLQSINGQTVSDPVLGAADVGGLAASANLSDVPSPSTARGNLGLGSAAQQPSSAFDAAGAATAAQAAAVQRANHTGTQTASTISDLGGVTLTFTNKRVTKRVGTTPSVATLTIDSDNRDGVKVTALAGNLTIAAPTGTPTTMQQVLIKLKDDGTSRTITWNAVFRAVGVTLPTATVAGKTLYVGILWNSEDSVWDVIAVGQQA